MADIAILGRTTGYILTYNPASDTLDTIHSRGQVYADTLDGLKIYAKATANDESTGNISLFEVQSAAGAAQFSVNETGDVSCRDFVATGDVDITGDLVVDGARIGDNHLYMNDGYTTAVAQTGGVVVNYLPTATADTVAATGFVAGVAGVSNPTVHTTGAATFALSDLIQIKDTTDKQNSGLFEVLSHAANVLTIRGIGTVGCAEDFTQDQFATDTSVAGSIVKVTISVIRAGTDGVWETGAGSSTGIVFSDLATSAGITLQAAYEAGNTILIDAGEGDLSFTVDETNPEADFIVTGAAVYLQTDATNKQLALGSAGVTVGLVGEVHTNLVFDDGAARQVTIDSQNLTLSTTTSGTLAVSSAGSLDMDGVAVTLSASGALNIDGVGAGSLAVDSGNLALETTTSGNVLLTSVAQVIATVADDTASAFLIQEGANAYLGIDTSNGSELIHTEVILDVNAGIDATKTLSGSFDAAIKADATTTESAQGAILGALTSHGLGADEIIAANISIVTGAGAGDDGDAFLAAGYVGSSGATNGKFIGLYFDTAGTSVGGGGLDYDIFFNADSNIVSDQGLTITGAGGNVTLQTLGGGDINLISSGDVAFSTTADNGDITFSCHGTGTVDILSGTGLNIVDADGLLINGIAINATAVGASGSELIGVDTTGLPISAPAATDLQTVLEALDAAAGGGDSSNYQTLTGTLALADDSVKYQMLNPGVASRTVTLPDMASVGKVFVIRNTASASSSYYISIQCNTVEYGRVYPQSTVVMLWRSNHIWDAISLVGEGTDNGFGKKIQMGYNSYATGDYGVSIGTTCTGVGNSVSIGASCSATGNYPLAIGSSAAATAGSGAQHGHIAIGRSAVACSGGVSIGKSADANGGSFGVAVGYEAGGQFEGVGIGYKTDGDYYCVAIGSCAKAETPAALDPYRIAIGGGTGTPANATAQEKAATVKTGAACGIALGTDTYVNSDYGIAIGYQAKCANDGAVVLGRVAAGTILSSSENYAVHGNIFHAENSVILKEVGSAPTGITDKGTLYAKVNGTATDLYWKNGADDEEVQITNDSYLASTFKLVKGVQGSDLASANDMAAPASNYQDVTGTTQVNTMAATSITAGTFVTLQFDDSVTVKNATPGAGAQFQLSGSGDFAATAGDILMVVYDGTDWREVSRTVF